MKLFVTGGSGFIGSRFCKLALQQDHQVVTLVRPSSASRVSVGVQRVYGSLPYDIPASALAGVDAIVHLAAITTSDKAAESQAVNEYGTDYLLRLAKTARTPVIFTSTQSVYGKNASAYATTKRRCEEIIRASGNPWAILRPGLVYGPGSAGLFARMRATVKRMPALPLLGGGKALVQPIHVDDLCAAMLTILDDFSAFEGGEYDLGDPEGLPLKDFLKGIAIAEGKPTRHVNVPLAPVKVIVGFGEKLRVPLPVSMDNLRGLENVQRMDTAPSLQRLGLTLRNLQEGLRQSVQPVERERDDRIPVVLIGAGKIGIVHGLQIIHNSAARLAGVVEPNPKPANLYRSMGFNAPFYGSLNAALNSNDPPQAAIIATPADTHLAVAHQCLDAGLHILVEKPLSVNREVAEEWRFLREKYPHLIVHSGYMAAQFPHLLTAYHLARMNKLGHIHKARGVALQTHIMAAEPVRWEMLKARAGGGVMINFGCHVASMLFRLLGWPDTEVRGWQWPIHSTEVEDAVAARFSIKSTRCTLLACWSVPGYARPYNLVELECEHGTLRVENSCITVVESDGHISLKTQLDYDLPFNMSPDYTGGGFTEEHEAFTSSIKSIGEGRSAGAYKMEFMPPVEMPEALRLENWIRSLYETLPQEKPATKDLEDYGFPPEIINAVLTAVGDSK